MARKAVQGEFTSTAAEMLKILRFCEGAFMERVLNPELNEHQQGRRTMGPRFQLAVPVRFQWKEADGTEREGLGTTRDISGHGIFIKCDRVPPVGVGVVVILDLPPPRGSPSAALLYGEGKAIREEQAGGRPVGFAAEVAFHGGWEFTAPT